jgi:hypothetical protein
VPTCASSFCDASGDSCCALPQAQCGADAACQPGTTCLPLVDECASVLTKTGCTAAAFCK